MPKRKREYDIFEDLEICGFKEIPFKELKVDDIIIYTYRNTLATRVNGLILRNAVVTEVNGYVMVKTSKSGDQEIMLLPGNFERDEKYYRRDPLQ